MRRGWALATAAVVTGASLWGGNAAAKPTTRRVFETYSPAKLSNWRIDPGAPGASLSEIQLYSRVGETSVSIEVVDESGQPVRVGLQQEGMPARAFCSATSEPLKIVPSEAFSVIVYSGLCDGAPAAATAGTVTVTFHGTRGGSR